jgi:4-hydroxybenzoate polyprenyltransferase
MSSAGRRGGAGVAVTRWVAYQRERFPLAGHAPLVAAFSASAVCFSALLRGSAAAPRPEALFVAFITSLLFFLQLRIADEFKDRDEDARFRPYRPVPRGLVTLRELACVGVGAGTVQLGFALWLHPPLVWLLVPAWACLALMTREFFAPRWLRAHPLIYMASHMLILPLIDLYATACDWRLAGERTAPSGLFWFLVVSYLNGIVIEIGRKTRAPADEERGVETYSAIWGVPGAARAWLLAILLTGAAAWEASTRIGTAAPTVLLLGCLISICGVVAHRFVRDARRGSGKSIEVMAGIWTFLMYVGLGAAPLALAYWQEAP